MSSAHADEDTEAMRHCQQGDTSALDDLVVRYQVPAVRLAYILVRDRSSAEDIVQESFLLVYQKCAQFRDGEPFAPWFYRIVLNRARQYLRAVKRRPACSWEQHVERTENRAQEASDTFSVLLADRERLEADPVAHLEQTEVRAAVLAILHTLTPKQREVLALRYYCGYTDNEIASILKIAGGAVRWRHHAALQSFKRNMQRLHPWLAGNTYTPTPLAPVAPVAPQALLEGGIDE